MCRIVDNRGAIVSATLANEVNLHDVERRNAFLLGRAKDNNASYALDLLTPLFDGSFSLDDVSETKINIRIEEVDGYELEGQSLIREISSDPEDLVAQAIGTNHQYLDSLTLLTGTMFTPVEHRREAGGLHPS